MEFKMCPLKTSVAVSFSSCTWWTVSSPVTMSSRLLMISSTCFGYSVLQVCKCCCKVPLRGNADCRSPNEVRLNLKVSTCEESLALIQWNRKVSRSASLSGTCKKACLIMSSHKATGLRRFLTITLQSKFVEVAQSQSNLSLKGHVGLP